MLKLVLDSYKMFLKNFPVILLFATPLLLLSGISIWIENSETINQGVLYFYYASFVLIPLVSIATDISLYRRLFGYSIINPLCSIKAFILYLITQLSLGLVASAPIILFRYIFVAFGMSNLWAFVLALATNMFMGIYLLARFNILFPLIIQNKVPSLKEFSQYTARSYKEWMSVTFLIYMPYVVFNYAILSPTINMLVINLFAFVFVCFNIKYVSTFRIPEDKSVAIKKIDTKVNSPIANNLHTTKIEKVSSKEKKTVKTTTKKASSSKATSSKATSSKTSTTKKVAPKA